MSSRGKITIQRCRAPHRVHLLAWMLALDKDGFTSCHLLTCHFMASSMEEIIDHFKGFKCMVRFPYVCELCQRGTDNEISLLYHNIYVHGMYATEKQKSSVFEYLSAKKKVTPYIRKAWTLYLKRKGYLKCLKRVCNLVLPSLQEMEAHYLNDCSEETWPTAGLRDRPTCPTCSGQFTSASELERHVTRHHLQELRLTAFAKETSRIGLDERRDQWTHEIIGAKQALCPVPGCKFVNNRLAVMENHFKTCTGKYHPSFKVCNHCTHWLPNSVELESHIQLFHKDLPVFTVPDDNFPTRSDEGNGARKMYQRKKPIRQQEIQNNLKSQESGSNFKKSALSSVTELNKNLDQAHRKVEDSSLPHPVAACQSSATPKIKLKPKCKNIDFNENQKDLSKIQYSTDLLTDYNQQNSTFDEFPFVTINVNDAEVKSVKKPSRICKKQVQPCVTNVNIVSDKLLPSTLEDVAKNLAAETDIPVDVTYVGNDGNINIHIPNMSKVQETFPTDIDSVLKALRKDSFSILDKVAQKTVIRNDVKKFLIPSSKRLFSFDVSVKNNSSSNSTSEFIIDDEQDCALEQQNSDRMNMNDGNGILIDFNELETDLIKVENSGDTGKEQNDTTIRVLSPIVCESSQNIAMEQSETPIILQSEDGTIVQSISNNILESPRSLNSSNSCETTKAFYVPKETLRIPKSDIIKENISSTLTSINEIEKTKPDFLSVKSKSINTYEKSNFANDAETIFGFYEEETETFDDEKMSNDGSLNNDDSNCDDFSDDGMESQVANNENINKIVGDTNVCPIKTTVRQCVDKNSKSISLVCSESVQQDANTVDAIDNNNDLKLFTNEQNFHIANNCFSNDVNKNAINPEEKPGFEYANLCPDSPQNMNTAQDNNCILLDYHLPKSILSIKHNNFDLRTVSEECSNNLNSDASIYSSVNLKKKLTPQRGGPKTRGGTRIRRGQELRGIPSNRGDPLTLSGTNIRGIPKTCGGDNQEEIPDAGLKFNLSEDTMPGIVFMDNEMYTVSVRGGVRILDPVHIPDSSKTVSSHVSGSGAESSYGFTTKKASDVFRFPWKEIKPPQEIVVLNLSVDVPNPSSGVGSHSQDHNPTAPTPAEDHEGPEEAPALEDLNPNAPTATEDNNTNDPTIAEDHRSNVSAIAEVQHLPDHSAAADDNYPDDSTAAEDHFPDDSTAAEDRNMDPATNVEDQRSGDASYAEEISLDAPSPAEDRHSENASPAEDRHSDDSSAAEESLSDAKNDELQSNVHISIKISPFGISVNSKGKLINMSTVENYVTPDSSSPINPALTRHGRKRRDYVEMHDAEKELSTLENEFKEVSKSSEYGRGKRKSRTSVDETNLENFDIVAPTQSQYYPNEPPTKKGRRPKRSLKLDSETFKILGKSDPVQDDVESNNEPSENALTPSYSWKKHGKWKKNVTNQNPMESQTPFKQDGSMLTPVKGESLKNVQDNMDKSENDLTPAQSGKFGIDMSSSAFEKANSPASLSLGSSDSMLQSESQNVMVKDTNDNSGSVSRPFQSRKKPGRPRKKIKNSKLIVTPSSSTPALENVNPMLTSKKFGGISSVVECERPVSVVELIPTHSGRRRNPIGTPSTSTLENADPILKFEKSESIVNVEDNNDAFSENDESSIQSGSQRNDVTNQNPISTPPSALENANSSAPLSLVSSHSMLQSESLCGAMKDINDDSGNISRSFQTKRRSGRARKKITNSNLIVVPSSSTSALENVNPMLTSEKFGGISSVVECESPVSVDELTPTHSGRRHNPIGTPSTSTLENADPILKFEKSESIANVEDNSDVLFENDESSIQSESQKNDVTNQNPISTPPSALENANSSAPLSLASSHSMLQSESLCGAMKDINDDSGNISRSFQTKRKPGRPRKKITNSNLIVLPSSTSALENVNPMLTSKKSAGINSVVECENPVSVDELTPTDSGRGQNPIENPSTSTLENADSILKSKKCESIVKDSTEDLSENNDSSIQSGSQKNDVTDQNLISASSSASENANSVVPLSLASSDVMLQSESISVKDNKDNSGNISSPVQSRKRPGRPRKKIANSNLIVTPSSSTSALENVNPILTSKKSPGINSVVECEKSILKIDKSESIVNIKDNNDEDNESAIPSGNPMEEVTKQNPISTSSLENADSMSNYVSINVVEGVNDKAENISTPIKTGKKRGRPRKSVSNQNFNDTPSSSTGPDIVSKSSDYRRGKRKSRISVNNISFADINEFGFDNVDDESHNTTRNCDEPPQKKGRAVKSQKYSDSEEFITAVQSENSKPSNSVENENDVSNTFSTPVGFGRKRGKLKKSVLSSTPITALLSSPSDVKNSNSQLISEEVDIIKTDNEISITSVLTPVGSGNKKRGRPRKKLTNSKTIDSSSTSVVDNSMLTSDTDMSSCLDVTTDDCYSDKEHNDVSRDSDHQMSDDQETSENTTYRWGRPSRAISLFDSTPGESEQVTCVKCKDNMTRKSFRKFHIKKHNFMTWAEEDEPLDFTNDTLLCSILNRAKRLYPGFIFRCELCRYFCRAAVSFVRHYRRCDGSTPLVAKNKVCKSKTPNFDIVGEEVPLTDPSEGTSTGTDRVSTKQTRKYEKCIILDDRIDCLVKLTVPDAMVKCAVCGESMTAKSYQKNHMIKHGFVCWLEGEEPLPENDLKTMTNWLNRFKKHYEKKFRGFTCELCGIVKKSAAGFVSHRLICGRSEDEVSELLAECTHCGRMMRPLSLAAHIYQTHRNEPSIPDSSPAAPSYGGAEVGGVEDVTAETPDLKRRSTATKCLNQMSNFLDDESDDKEADDEDFKPLEGASSERECYVVKARRPRKLVKTLWMKSFSQGKSVVCPLRSSTEGERCTFKARDLATMIGHYQYCTFNAQEYKCKGCDYSNTDEQDVKSHAVSCVGDEDYDSSLEESQERLAIPFLRHLEKRSNIRRHFFVPALHLAKEAYGRDEEASESPLFPDFQVTPSDCLALSEESEEGRPYKPVRCRSLPLRSGDSSSSQATFTQLPTFQSRLLNDGEEAIGYTGGAVTSLAWTPAWDTSLEQYLACSSGHQGSGQEELQVGSTYRGPGLIQIWSTGPLSNCTVESDPVRLEYVYGLCHDEHTVWSLAWCPGRDGSDTSRLGLLAAATASGSIPIYALPKPAHLPLSTSRFFKVKPVLRLETPSSEKCQCSAIAWSKVKPYRIVAGGFANGVIGIWDLSLAGSPLLGTSRGTLRPIKIFNAHHSLITGVCLSEESEDFLVSSSFDRSIKFWELRDTSSPLSTSYRGVTTGLDWLSTWLSCATSYDFGYANNGKTNVLNSLRGFAQSRSIHYGAKASSLDVSANNWLNAVAASFENGQVIVTFLLKHMGHRREIPRYNKVLMQCKMVDLKKIAQTLTDSEKNDIEETLPPSEKYGLEIKTDLKVRNFGANDSLSIDTSPGRMDLHQLAAVNKVAWNTSRSGFTYLASGLESGFLVLTRLSFPVPEQKIIQSIR